VIDMNEKGQALLDGIQAHRGYTMEMHRILADRHPDFLDGYDTMFRAAMSEDSPLDPGVRELLVMAVDIVVGMKPEVVRAHARKAMAHGATEAQVLAAVEITTLVSAGRALGSVVGVFGEDDAIR
jgi:alkylhydroperoxidase/carboxymuconolactone decarboxylase family protein YurZ